MKFISRSPRLLVPARKVLGVDASLTSTGFSYRSGGVVVTGRITGGELRSSYRLQYMRAQLMRHLGNSGASLVALEGYAMGVAGGGRTFDIGELGGVLKVAIWELGVDVLVIPPSVMKSVIAGSGGAKKEAVIAAVGRKLWPIPAPTQNDEADAAALMLVGELYLKAPGYVVKSSGKKPPRPLADTCELIPGRLKATSKMS